MKDHQHKWTVESSHRISIGCVVYERCGCGDRRIVGYESPDPATLLNTDPIAC
jgi:hypothetical protein